MLVRMWYKWNSNTLFVGLQGGKITLDNSWQFLINLNIHSSGDPAITLSCPREKSTYMYPPENLYTNVYSSFMHNSPN